MSATSIAFASWFIRNLDIDLSPHTIDSIISRIPASWDNFSCITPFRIEDAQLAAHSSFSHETPSGSFSGESFNSGAKNECRNCQLITAHKEGVLNEKMCNTVVNTELPLEPVLPKPRAKKHYNNNILQSVATNTDELPVTLTDNVDVHEEVPKVTKKPTKPRVKKPVDELQQQDGEDGDVVTKKPTKPRAKQISKPVEHTDNLIDSFQQVSLGEDETIVPAVNNKVNKKPTKPRAKQISKPVEHTDNLIDSFQQVSLGEDETIVPAVVPVVGQFLKRSETEVISEAESVGIEGFSKRSGVETTKEFRRENENKVAKKPRAKKIAKPIHVPSEEVSQKHNPPRVKNTEPTDNHNNTIIISSIHHDTTIDNNSNDELLEEEDTHTLTEVFVNDVLFYFDQTHNSWFDYSLSTVSDPTI